MNNILHTLHFQLNCRGQTSRRVNKKLSHKMKSLLVAFCLLVLVEKISMCQPPPHWEPQSIKQLTNRAPIAVKAYMVKQKGSGLFESMRCIHIETVYKGVLHPGDYNYLCASRFGPSAACLSDFMCGIPYFVFLDKVGAKNYIAHYGDIHGASKLYSRGRAREVAKGVCCPNEKGKYLHCLI